MIGVDLVLSDLFAGGEQFTAGAFRCVYDGADDTRTLTWAKTGGLFNSGATKGLSIQFGPNDKMVKVVGQP